MKRTCDVCGCGMDEGYLVHDTEYYCSETCLQKRYSGNEYAEMYEADDAYWTEWECDDEEIYCSERWEE